MNVLKFFGNSVDHFHFAEASLRAKYAWIVVVRNEGNTFVNQIKKITTTNIKRNKIIIIPVI